MPAVDLDTQCCCTDVQKVVHIGVGTARPRRWPKAPLKASLQRTGGRCYGCRFTWSSLAGTPLYRHQGRTRISLSFGVLQTFRYLDTGCGREHRCTANHGMQTSNMLR